ncbi:MAG: Hsp20/alpha crystallin family protein [Holophaga sp.]
MPKLRHKKPASAPSAPVRRLMGWDPFLDQDVAKVAREADPVFNPSFDILETHSCYVFLADLPGVRGEDLEITWTAGRITLTGTREPEPMGDEADFYALERTFGRFSRSFTLPAGACPDRTSATLKAGVLTVRVPKAPADAAGRITIHDQEPALSILGVT